MRREEHKRIGCIRHATRQKKREAYMSGKYLTCGVHCEIWKFEIRRRGKQIPVPTKRGKPMMGYIVVLYGCETWSLTLREEHRLRVFENSVLRRIFGPKKNEVIGGWRKLHTEELHNLYYSLSIIRMIKSRRMRWAGHVARMGRRELHVEFWWESRKERDH
jgi:hypothetical protein